MTERQPDIVIEVYLVPHGFEADIKLTVAAFIAYTLEDILVAIRRQS